MAGSRIWRKATEGTYIDSCAPRGVAVVFSVMALAFALVPFVGMAWARTDVTAENRELAGFPEVVEEGGSFNWDILSDLGDYFDDHFAYRNEAVTANARLRAALDTSATDQVIIGDDGWLYYGGTLPDYLGQSQLSERSLVNIAHNLALAQSYAEKQGAAFVFALAPNKNSLDASHMPYYYLRYSGASNFDRLKPWLDDFGVNYVDLFSLFERQMSEGDDFEYLKLDSHWNNRWALIATNEMLESLGRNALPIDPSSAIVRHDFAGDLQSMLYPASEALEDNYYYEGFNDLPGDGGANWEYDEGADVTDSMVRAHATESANDAEGSVLMFRDSFGNALVPLWASAFASSAFSKLVPYNLTQISQVKADAVVIERAERHLDYLATNPPIMSNPAQTLEEGLPDGAEEAHANVDVTTSGSYWVVRGEIDEPLPAETTHVHVVVERPGEEPVVFDPFWTSSADEDGAVVDDRGLLMYVPTSAMDLSDAAIRVFVS